MNLKEKKFPGQKIETKKPTAFRKIPLVDLEAKAIELNLDYRKSDNDSITRMWVTKALADVGVTPEDFLKGSDADED